MRRNLLAIGLAGIGALGASAALAAQSGVLASLAPGAWELRTREGAVYGRVCVGDRWRLVQIAHGGLDCRRFVKRDSGDTLEVAYSCPGHGQGSTVIRRETDRLVQIRSTGLRDGSPFEVAVEARRTGRC